MSDNPLPPVEDEVPSAPTNWGPVIISAYVMTIMLAALGFSVYVFKNDIVTTALVNAIVINFTVVVQFWVGSSHSSQTKDGVISRITRLRR